jgi:hypothetical protein
MRFIEFGQQDNETSSCESTKMKIPRFIPIYLLLVISATTFPLLAAGVLQACTRAMDYHPNLLPEVANQIVLLAE